MSGDVKTMYLYDNTMHPPLRDVTSEILCRLDVLTDDELELVRKVVAEAYRHHLN